MAQTVNAAFSEFMDSIVNLDTDETKTARTSRDNLIDHICTFSGDEDFFNVYKEHNLKFGSFARHTKIRPLDDIDIMICLSASNNGERRTYNEFDDCIYIEGIGFDFDNALVTPNTYHLNSTKVINRLIAKLSQLKDYRKAEMHKNHEAATLQLRSYEWNFDIVPCFYTESGLYLISDGCGNWKKTDPRIDNDWTTELNQKHRGKLLDVIRLMKYWNSQRHTIRIPSYMLECMILSVYDNIDTKDRYWIYWEIRDLFSKLSTSIISSVPDPKGIQGDLNSLSLSDRLKIKMALHEAHQKAIEATNLERSNPKGAINKWREIFGDSFPTFTN